jgi:hypothetical protein
VTTYVPELLLPQVASLFKNLGKPNAAAGTWVAVQLMLYVTRASRFQTFLSSRMTCLHGQTNMVRRIGGDDGRFYGYLGGDFSFMPEAAWQIRSQSTWRQKCESDPRAYVKNF